jgi:hypothetical protein
LLLLFFLLLLVFLLLFLLLLLVLFLLLLLLLVLFLLFLLLFLLPLLFFLLLLLLARYLLLLDRLLLLLQLLLLFIFLLLLVLVLLLLILLLLLLLLRLLLLQRLLLLLELLFDLLALLYQLLILLHHLLVLRLLTGRGPRRGHWWRWRQRWQLNLLSRIIRHLLLIRAIGRRSRTIHRGAASQEGQEGHSQDAPAYLTDSSHRWRLGSQETARCHSCVIFITRSLNQHHVTQDQHPILSLLSRSITRRLGIASAAREPG